MRHLIDPHHPVLVAAHAVENRTKDAEPIDMMVDASIQALGRCESSMAEAIESVRVVKGIWPYVDPGRLVADRLNLGDVTTALTQIGGNAAYDLVNQTAAEIAAGELSAALICGAETMRTRRSDRAAGSRSTYVPEPEDATPDLMVGADVELVDESDAAAGVAIPVNFYAMVETAIRHGNNETPNEHLDRISNLWATGSDVAATNPSAWITTPATANDIATATPTNRMIASPYTKLMTSNINVDQGAALLLCSYECARAHDLDDSDLVFLLSGAGAYDHLSIRSRDRLDESPALRESSATALELAGLSLDGIDHLDLYSCFPSAVQLAQAELGLDASRPFTITGGLTFAGGPFNGYCTQALTKAVGLLAGTDETVFLYGNGGYFSKHSVILASGAPPERPFVYERPQDAVDIGPTRPIADADTVADGQPATVEAYTVVFDRGGVPTNAILSALDGSGRRWWALATEPDDLARLLETDAVGNAVTLHRHAEQAHDETQTLTAQFTR